ncbi:MAG: hypothetical protein M0R74_03375 [Dehalococcoidia bacterium]|jgi:uncharacterized membrane protein|nr:hypothetical protein [Dehalococcoidia bacterium]
MKINLKLPKIRLPSRDTTYDLLSELAMLAGFFMFGYGLYLIYPPAMFIICGVCLFLFGYPKRRVK